MNKAIFVQRYGWRGVPLAPRPRSSPSDSRGKMALELLKKLDDDH